MKLSKQVVSLCEDGLSGLSESELKKFWKDFQENVLLEDLTARGSSDGFFGDGAEFDIGSVPMMNKEEIDHDFFTDPESFGNLIFKSYNPKDIVAIMLNEYTLERETTDEEENQAFEYMLKHLKGQEVTFAGHSEADGYEFKWNGKIKIKNFKFDAVKDILEVTDYDTVSLEVEQR